MLLVSANFVPKEIHVSGLDGSTSRLKIPFLSWVNWCARSNLYDWSTLDQNLNLVYRVRLPLYINITTFLMHIKHEVAHVSYWVELPLSHLMLGHLPRPYAFGGYGCCVSTGSHRWQCQRSIHMSGGAISWIYLRLLRYLPLLHLHHRHQFQKSGSLSQYQDLGKEGKSSYRTQWNRIEFWDSPC